MTYDGQLIDGTLLRLHIDNLDAEYAFLMMRTPDEHSKWVRIAELRQPAAPATDIAHRIESDFYDYRRGR